MDLDRGQVVLELAPTFAPELLRNLRTLVRGGWFDGLSINRVQDNFVTQWGDAEGDRPLGAAAVRVTPEFERDWSAELRFTPLPDGDVFAPQVGFVDGFPVAGDRAAGRIWMAHCYGAVGVGRDSPADSGNGSELYVVIGHAPRQLDRNITVVGRVVMGTDLLAALPRGTQALGFYATAAERVPIRRVRFADDLPPRSARSSRRCAPTRSRSAPWSRRDATVATIGISDRRAGSTSAAYLCRCARFPPHAESGQHGLAQRFAACQAVEAEVDVLERERP